MILPEILSRKHRCLDGASRMRRLAVLLEIVVNAISGTKFPREFMQKTLSNA